MPQFYVGVDVSKGYADFAILDSNKQPLEGNFQLDDTFHGHCCLYDKLSKFAEDHADSTIYAAVESTGGYENNWFNALVRFQGSLNLKTARLNPLGVNANSKADLKRVVTDRISAQSIAEFLIAHPEKVSYNQQDNLASLRKQWAFIRMLTKQHTQLLNHLESLVYTANPELMSYCKDGVPVWILKLLTRYPTASTLSRARVSSLVQIPYVSRVRAQELIEVAKKSVASSTDEITGQLVVATVKQILHLKQVIDCQTQTLAKQSAIPEVSLLRTFTGIGDFSAIGLMLEIQSVSRFSSAKKLASYFGLHPVYKTSGDSSSGFHMSKKGRKEPRRILFMVTLNAIKTNSLIRSVYLERTEKGMTKMSAIGLCMHKILRIIYGMLKHNSSFDPEIDRKNKERASQTITRDREDKNRRYQGFDSKAPVSRRESAKRKERKQSHNGNATKTGIIVSAPVLI